MRLSRPGGVASPSRARLAAVALLVVALAALGFGVDFSAARDWLAAQRELAAARPITAASLYFAAYLLFAALSLPGAWTLSVAGGALFGAWAGPPLVSLSSAAGATLAMLAARHLFRDAVANRFPVFVARVDRGVARDGARWLFAARLTPVLPYFAVNLAAGLTQMRAWTFARVTLIGAFPFAWIYAEAGAELARVERPFDVLNGWLILIFAALAALPFAIKGAGALLRIPRAPSTSPARPSRPDKVRRGLERRGWKRRGKASASFPPAKPGLP
jgi:uncharacterized membrane protein YdjX (TVP38/TMEM64 family)